MSERLKEVLPKLDDSEAVSTLVNPENGKSRIFHTKISLDDRIVTNETDLLKNDLPHYDEVEFRDRVTDACVSRLNRDFSGYYGIVLSSRILETTFYSPYVFQNRDRDRKFVSTIETKADRGISADELFDIDNKIKYEMNRSFVEIVDSERNNIDDESLINKEEFVKRHRDEMLQSKRIRKQECEARAKRSQTETAKTKSNDNSF